MWKRIYDCEHLQPSNKRYYLMPSVSSHSTNWSESHAQSFIIRGKSVVKVVFLSKILHAVPIFNISRRGLSQEANF